MTELDQKPPLRVAAVALATLAGIGVPAVQMGMGLGLSQRAFAADGDSTLRAAPYAFSIWSVIYLGLVAYAVWQALPRTPESRVLKAFGWPSVGAIAGCGLWIVAASADMKWATVAIIFATAGYALWPLVQHTDTVHEARGAERAVVVWPLGMLAGWLTVASPINLLTVLTAEGVITPATAPAWGAAGALAVIAIGLWVTWKTRLFAYAAPVAWGLVAVFVAERTPKPTLANLPLIGSLLVLALGGAAALSRQRPRDGLG
jgi:hypothetical protein